MRNSTIDWTDAVIARFRALWAEGHSTAEIGRRLGISKNAVVGKAHRINLPARPSPISRKGGSSGGQPRRIRSEKVPLPTFASVTAPPPPVAAPSPSVFAPIETSPISHASAEPRPAGRIQDCCWPIGQPGHADFHFCSDPSEPGKPYCSNHCRSAYVRTPRPSGRTTSAPA